MPKVVRIFKDEMAPRFLLFLKARRWRRADDDLAKTSAAMETIVFVAFCFVLLAIVAIAYEKVRNH
jgi:hypothetical protein